MNSAPAALLALLLSAPSAFAAAANASDWSVSTRSRARLVADGSTTAGVEIRLAPGFVTYWRTPGAAGVPPRFDFAGSTNLAAAAPLYPVPNRLDEAGLTAFGYTDTVTFPIVVTPADRGKPVTLAIKLDYGVCKDICIPAQAKAALTLPAGVSVGPFAPALAAARARVPGSATASALGAAFAVKPSPAGWTVEVTAAGAPPDLFAEAPDGWWIEASKPTPLGPSRYAYEVALKQKPNKPAWPLAATFTLSGDAPREIAVALPPPG
ncbi:MAG: hypothetical protein KGI57_07085 [Hyphomicrobiales bacterium]|nr:hypothetical protein [Hyphomicrobiales bacterium]